jgi:hypothetical protein
MCIVWDHAKLVRQLPTNETTPAVNETEWVDGVSFSGSAVGQAQVHLINKSNGAS